MMSESLLRLRSYTSVMKAIILSLISTHSALSGLITKMSNTIKSSGKNMSNSVKRKPSVMTFRCERLIGRYGNTHRVVQYLEIIIQVELAFRGYNLSKETL